MTPALNIVTPSGPSAFATPVHTPLILLVDDDRIMRTVISQSLKQKGYQVMEAQHGEEALATLVQHGARIDAVVLDREMPGLNGLEVVARRRQNASFPAFPS